MPPGLAVAVTYNGSATPPTAPGSYSVVATVLGGNYVGSATGTLQISTTATVRHTPSINGRVEGSVEVLLPESGTLNGGAVITSDLLVPGTPTVRLNGSPTYGGTADGDGAASPSNYTITLNGGARLRHVVRRTDAVVLPAVQTPPPPTGTRDVVITSPGQNPGNFATVRNLTLNGGVGAVTVPAGTYGMFNVNGNSSLVLGVAGATTPAVYNLQGLTVNGGASVTIVGPVVINLASGLATNGMIGAAAHPQWLALNFATGGLTVNGGATVHGAVLAPTGAVMVNGTVNGSVAADRLTLNGGAVLKAVQ
jgi:rhamnogalacturonan endolyase